ncbi:MAG: radical SAM protein, partial [Lachnospiraceae bacterium]|nr:radical SAM protein [Lachnospiraceae bacterium]
MNETEKYRVLTLVLTYNCNLACDYCFCGRKRKENMSAEKAKEAIDFFMKNAEENANIVFFGGEPLLQADLIREVIRYCRERYGERTTFSITTNGTLLTKENVALIE